MAMDVDVEDVMVVVDVPYIDAVKMASVHNFHHCLVDIANVVAVMDNHHVYCLVYLLVDHVSVDPNSLVPADRHCSYMVVVALVIMVPYYHLHDTHLK
jgi:hypothetical protein